MIIEIKKFLNGENEQFPIQLQELSQTDEGYQLWKYQIFKLRKLNQEQIEKVYQIFEQSFILNFPQIETNEKLTEYLSICRQCCNFTAGKYVKWNVIYEKLLLQKHQFILDKLIILGESELVFVKCDEELISNLSSIYLKKFLKFVIVSKTIFWKKYQNVIKADSQLILKVVLSAKISQNTEPIIYEIIQAGDNEKNIFDSLVMDWSNKNFIINASLKTQLYVSNLIVLFLKNGFTNDMIHDGIQKRLNTQASIPRKCGILVWKQFVELLNIQTNCPVEEFEQEEIDEIWETKKKEESKKVDSIIAQPSDEFNNFEEDETIPDASVVKNLYDCVLALRSEDQNRINEAFKHLPYLIRHGLDIHVHGETICDIIILGRDWTTDQEIMRIQVLVSLSIMRPQIADLLIEKYFSEEISMMQRILILKIIRESAIELSSNPKKYPLESFDKYDQQQNSTFYFKQISTIYSDERQTKIIQRPEPPSRRWGHTKRAHQGLQIVQPYVNKFHELTDHFYFPLIVYSQAKHKLLLTRESLLMLNFLEVLLNMIDCGQNSLHKAKLISEALDFLIVFEKSKNIEIILMKLRIMLKIVILLKGEFDERVPKILISLKHDDERVKQLYDLIVQYI